MVKLVLINQYYNKIERLYMECGSQGGIPCISLIAFLSLMIFVAESTRLRILRVRFHRMFLAKQSVFGAFHDPTLWLRRSAYLQWWRLSIIVNKNASNEQNADKIVTVLNKFSYYAKGREAAEEAQKAIAERAKVKADD